ncbi:GNAT family N-acetyltransferase [Collinsella ureilytica]|nr:GNAT family N-acetyltransferase [Collinsella urealyticum]
MEFIESNHSIRYVDHAGKMLAEITFPETEAGIATIDHTCVDPTLRGQGIAGQLMEQALKVIEREGLKVRPTCSYAASWFERHPDRSDLLA